MIFLKSNKELAEKKKSYYLYKKLSSFRIIHPISLAESLSRVFVMFPSWTLSKEMTLILHIYHATSFSFDKIQNVSSVFLSHGSGTKSSVNMSSCNSVHVFSCESVAAICKLMPYITRWVVNFNINNFPHCFTLLYNSVKIKDIL